MQSDRQHIHITSLIRYENTEKLSIVNLKRRFLKILQSCRNMVSRHEIGMTATDHNGWAALRICANQTAGTLRPLCGRPNFMSTYTLSY